jgi:thiosulfate/3-mercaptopyruvate sulfurtransferase
MSGYAHPESLVSTQWVSEHLDDPLVRIVEVVWGDDPPSGMKVYEESHLPGAVVWDYKNDYFNPKHGDVADKISFEEQLSLSGILPETTIVLYGGLNNMNATFEFWLLKVYGHRDVRLMDGGRRKWLEENRPVTRTVPVYASTTYHAQEPDWSLRASREDVLQAIGSGNIVLVDPRPEEMYRGIDKPGTKRGGHIPGAINLTSRWEKNPDGTIIGIDFLTTRPDWTFKTVDELRAVFDGLGIAPQKEIITYCLLGGVSTHAWFVLTQLLGYPHVREYDRSWAEWGNIEGLPIETY